MITYRTREPGYKLYNSTTVKVNDLGVTISADVKVSEQFQRVITF